MASVCGFVAKLWAQNYGFAESTLVNTLQGKMLMLTSAGREGVEKSAKRVYQRERI